MTARRILNGIGKAFKWTVIGGFGGWAIVAMIYTFVVTPLCFPLVVAVLLMGFMGITLFALASVSLYDLAQGNTDFSWFSLNDTVRKPKPPPSDVVETPCDLILPPNLASSPPPVLDDGSSYEIHSRTRLESTTSSLNSPTILSSCRASASWHPVGHDEKQSKYSV